MFISVEGVDGSGKTTQARLMHNFIHDYIVDHPSFASGVVLTNEPNDERLSGRLNPDAKTVEDMTLGQIVRTVIGTKDDVDETARLLLIYAARRRHLESVVAPSISAGKIVVCDRFYDSSIAYFGYKRNIGFDRAKRFVDILHQESLFDIPKNALMPEITFLLDTKPATAFDRIGNRNLFDKLDQMHENDVNGVRDVFLRLAKENPQRFVVINGNRSEEEVHKEMIEKFLQFAKSKMSTNS